MDTKLCIMLDGGFIEQVCKSTSKPRKNPDYIEKLAKSCNIPSETIHRIMFYHCGGFTGTAKLPISNGRKQFTANNRWLDELSYKDLFSVRLGLLKFRGYTLKQTVPHPPGYVLSDADFQPNFEQKGVDMRIGIDIANICANKSCDVIALATNDTDCVPAMKYARRMGLQIVLLTFAGLRSARDLQSHADFRREIVLP